MYKAPYKALRKVIMKKVWPCSRHLNKENKTNLF